VRVGVQGEPADQLVTDGDNRRQRHSSDDITVVPSERLHAVIHGDVQGVGLRYFVMREARSLGLRGWVRNRDDGSVELVAEGDRRDLERLLDAARRGPSQAHVGDVRVDWSPPAGNLKPFDLTF
jgi:acylphosphatase